MRSFRVVLSAGLVFVMSGSPAGQQPPRQKTDAAPAGLRLEELTWPEAERHLGADAVVVLPVGAGAKEHGPHLQLRNDLTLADYLTRRVVDASRVVVAPTLTYHFYPAFVDYPGSTSLDHGTARDATAEIVRSLARFGPRRFYVLNTGISTLRPLRAAAKLLANEGVLLHYANLEDLTAGVVRQIQQQPGGTHADEIETSMMLYIDPSVVDMSKAVRDYLPSPPGPLKLTRDAGGAGTYSPSGVWGDATLATREKGRLVVEALVAGILTELDALRKTPLPSPAARPPTVDPGRSGGPARGHGEPTGKSGCTAGDERQITALGTAFTLAWTNKDAQRLAALWAAEGDIVHTDGSVERTAQVIRQNRAYMFSRPEYRLSRHSLAIGNIRCLTDGVAVADGKWTLRDVVDAGGRAVPEAEGLCTLVVRKDPAWTIEAYRYTVKPVGSQPPSALPRPGFIEK